MTVTARGDFPRHDPEGRRLRYGLKFLYPEIVGESPAIITMLLELDVILDATCNVHLRGESGTGKELVARAIASRGEGPPKIFEAHNASAISEKLLESLMFGYEKGAFHGADKMTPGAFERCDKGTLFLDEIADIHPDHQPKILRAVGAGELFRVGGTKLLTVQVRVVSATSRDIDAHVKDGKFREDLFFRIDTERITVPALRERLSDIPLLLEYFLGARATIFGREALDVLAAHGWPGNVRELKDVAERVERRVPKVEGAVATAALVRAQIRKFVDSTGAKNSPEPERPFKLLSRAEKREVLLKELNLAGWDIGVVARKLDYRRFSLIRLIKKLNISKPQSAEEA